ncbi:hypothetical protein D3C78_1815950 [compost metagenome]
MPSTIATLVLVAVPYSPEQALADHSDLQVRANHPSCAVLSGEADQAVMRRMDGDSHMRSGTSQESHDRSPVSPPSEPAGTENGIRREQCF